jgi:hypothetical protein
MTLYVKFEISYVILVSHTISYADVIYDIVPIRTSRLQSTMILKLACVFVYNVVRPMYYVVETVNIVGFWTVLASWTYDVVYDIVYDIVRPT